MKTILEYLRMPSTWAGIFSILTAFGMVISPEMQNEIMMTGMGAVGIALVKINENKKK